MGCVGAVVGERSLLLHSVNSSQVVRRFGLYFVVVLTGEGPHTVESHFTGVAPPQRNPLDFL